MPTYSKNNYRLNENQQKLADDHIIYYNKWGWVKPCLNFFTYGVLIILITYWFVFAIVALINNPPSQVNAICSNTGLNALLISQIIWSSFIVIERVINLCYKKTKPPIICTLCVSSWCLFIWCFGALWGKCSKQNLTTLDVYKSVYSWFIIYSTIIFVLFTRYCIYKHVRRMCFSNHPAIIRLDQPIEQVRVSSDDTTLYPTSTAYQVPLNNVNIPPEPVNYAEL